MKRLFTNSMLTVGLSALLGSFAPLVAQPATQLTADIPFAFHAQGKVIPAGSYKFISGAGQGVYQVLNAETRTSEFVNASVPRGYMPKKSELTFERHGSDYILSEISVAGEAHTHAVPPSAIEKSLTRKLGLAGMISVPLHSR